MASLSDLFASYLPLIEDDLHRMLETPPGMPPHFYRMMQYHMGWVDADGYPAAVDTGKRIRPVLTLLVAAACGGDISRARPAAAAVELIHNFSLLHDDIQDRSPLRRGRPTVWQIWGEKQAINAGDTMFALAHLAIPRLARCCAPDLEGMLLIRMQTALDEACLELTRGQHLDMSFEEHNQVTTDDYLDMIAGKTAALLAAAAYLGALSADVDEAVREHYRAFGHNLGMAFQVLDDVLDIWGEPELTGKEAAVDIRQRKKSLPVLYGLAHSPELRGVYDDPTPFDDDMVLHVRDLLDRAGARRYAEGLARQYSDQTLAHLEAAHPQGDAGRALYALVDRLLHRER
ncbi:MAG: polyprenyl synthetase family protein [Anaerolineae bacterium]